MSLLIPGGSYGFKKRKIKSTSSDLLLTSSKKKPRKNYSALTTYSINLIQFYNTFIRIKKYLLLQLLFVYTMLVMVVNIPFYFFVSLLFGTVSYSLPLSPAKLTEPNSKTKKKTIYERTALNSLIRRSLKKDFIKKYFDIDAVLDELEEDAYESETFEKSDFFASLDALAVKREMTLNRNDSINAIELPIVMNNMDKCHSVEINGTRRIENLTEISIFNRIYSFIIL